MGFKKIIFNSGEMSVEVEKFKVNGKEKEFVKFIQRDGVVILAINDNKLLLETHYRRAISKYVYELPAGHIDKGEKPVQAAKRELMEETGYAPKNLKLLFKAKEAQPRINNTLHFYLAYNFTKIKRYRDNQEIITSKWVSLQQFESMVKLRKITDLKTIAAYFYYLNHIKK